MASGGQSFAAWYVFISLPAANSSKELPLAAGIFSSNDRVIYRNSSFCSLRSVSPLPCLLLLPSLPRSKRKDDKFLPSVNSQKLTFFFFLIWEALVLLKEKEIENDFNSENSALQENPRLFKPF